MLVFLSVLALATEATEADRQGPPPAEPVSQTTAPAADAPAAPPCVDAESCEAVGFTQVKPIKQVEPEFPARKRGESATCKMRMFIDEEGRVTRVKLESRETCSPAFAEAAAAASLQWRFEPFLVDGEPSGATFVTKFQFESK